MYIFNPLDMSSSSLPLRLNSCLEEIQNVLGDSVPDWSIIDAVIAHNFDCEKSLDFLLHQAGDASEDTDETFSQSAAAPSFPSTT